MRSQHVNLLVEVHSGHQDNILGPQPTEIVAKADTVVTEGCDMSLLWPKICIGTLTSLIEKERTLSAAFRSHNKGHRHMSPAKRK